MRSERLSDCANHNSNIIVVKRDTILFSSRRFLSGRLFPSRQQPVLVRVPSIYFQSFSRLDFAWKSFYWLANRVSVVHTVVYVSMYVAPILYHYWFSDHRLWSKLSGVFYCVLYLYIILYYNTCAYVVYSYFLRTIDFQDAIICILYVLHSLLGSEILHKLNVFEYCSVYIIWM